ncbi:gghA [Symbiodinium sp. KB8]|nr:gghA [Symbiodinium sp. KB8]
MSSVSFGSVCWNRGNSGADVRDPMGGNRWGDDSGYGRNKGKGGSGAAPTELTKPCIWLGGLPRDISESEVDSVCCRYGTVSDINIKHSDRDTFVFVTYARLEHAQDAIQGLDQSKSFGSGIIKAAPATRREGGKGDKPRASDRSERSDRWEEARRDDDRRGSRADDVERRDGKGRDKGGRDRDWPSSDRRDAPDRRREDPYTGRGERDRDDRGRYDDRDRGSYRPADYYDRSKDQGKGRGSGYTYEERGISEGGRGYDRRDDYDRRRGYEDPPRRDDRDRPDRAPPPQRGRDDRRVERARGDSRDGRRGRQFDRADVAGRRDDRGLREDPPRGVGARDTRDVGPRHDRDPIPERRGAYRPAGPPRTDDGRRASRSPRRAPAERGANIRVNISNLPFDMEEAELKDTASTYGKVLALRVFGEADKPKRGWVEYATRREAEYAVTELDQRIGLRTNEYSQTPNIEEPWYAVDFFEQQEDSQQLAMHQLPSMIDLGQWRNGICYFALTLKLRLRLATGANSRRAPDMSLARRRSHPEKDSQAICDSKSGLQTSGSDLALHASKHAASDTNAPSFAVLLAHISTSLLSEANYALLSDKSGSARAFNGKSGSRMAASHVRKTGTTPGEGGGAGSRELCAPVAAPSQSGSSTPGTTASTSGRQEFLRDPTVAPFPTQFVEDFAVYRPRAWLRFALCSYFMRLSPCAFSSPRKILRKETKDAAILYASALQSTELQALEQSTESEARKPPRSMSLRPRWSAHLALCVLGFASHIDEGSPIIGMFSLPADPQSCGSSSSCEALPASYVRFIESAGGEVVPVRSTTSDAEMAELLRSLNGFLFTGGQDLDPPPAALRVLEHSRRMFEAGQTFPVWGTCLGFEWLVAAMSPKSLTPTFRAENVNLPVHLLPDAATSRLFAEAPTRVLKALEFQNVAFNSHHRGVSPAEFLRPELKDLKVLGTSFDEDGQEFASVIEGAAGLPWFGVQFHPEKNAFEHGLLPDGQPATAAKHGPDAIATTQFFANFFVQQARLSSQSFKSEAEEASRLIYGHQTSRVFQPYFDEVYLFSAPAVTNASHHIVLV